MTKARMIMAAVATVVFAGSAGAQSGPVAQACKSDITKYCAGKGHGDRQTRTCLENNKAKVSDACKVALESTGGARGRGQNRKN